MESQECRLQSACLSSLPWKSARVELQAKLEAEKLGSTLLEAAAPGSAVPAGCTHGWWDAASRILCCVPGNGPPSMAGTPGSPRFYLANHTHTSGNPCSLSQTLSWDCTPSATEVLPHLMCCSPSCNVTQLIKTEAWME